MEVAQVSNPSISLIDLSATHKLLEKEAHLSLDR